MWNTSRIQRTAHGPREGESEFHRVGSLLCPDCEYLEFPGCGRHNSLLSSRKGNGHYQCHGCVLDKHEREDSDSSAGVGQADLLGMLLSSAEVAATDTSSPWAESCRNCAQVRANPVTHVISDQVAGNLAAAMINEGKARDTGQFTQSSPTAQDELQAMLGGLMGGGGGAGGQKREGNLKTVMLHCQECFTISFPTVNGRLLRRESDLPDAAYVTQAPVILDEGEAEELQVIEGDVQLPADVPLDAVSEFSGHMVHYQPNCEGPCVAVPILLSMTEASYCAEALPTSPRLPLDRQSVPGFLRPVTWKRPEESKAKKLAESAHNAQYLLADIQRRSAYADHRLKRHKSRGRRGRQAAEGGCEEKSSSTSGAVEERKENEQDHGDSEEEEDRLHPVLMGQPVWRDRGYTGLFGDPFVRDTELEGGSIAPSVYMLRRVLQRIQCWTPQLRGWYLPTRIAAAAPDQRTRIQEVEELLHTCARIADEAWHVLLLDREHLLDREEQRKRDLNPHLSTSMDTEQKQKFEAKLAGMNRFLHRWKLRLLDLRPGEVILFPGGWLSPGGGHAMMHTLERSTLEEDGGTTFAFTIHNTGGGLEYHPSQSVVTEKGRAELGKQKFQSSLRFRGIPRDRVLDDALWIVFWRHQLFSLEEQSQHTLYQVVFPHLLGESEQISNPEDQTRVTRFSSVAAAALAESTLADPHFPVEWRTPQRAGTCYLKCMLQVMRYLFRRQPSRLPAAIQTRPRDPEDGAGGEIGVGCILRAPGLDSGETKQIALAVRRSVLGMVWTDLQHLNSGFQRDFREDDIMLLRLSTEQCSHAALKAVGREGEEGRLPQQALPELQELIFRIESSMQKLCEANGIWSGFDPARVLLTGQTVPPQEHPDIPRPFPMKSDAPVKYWLGHFDSQDVDTEEFARLLEKPPAPDPPAIKDVQLTSNYVHDYIPEETELAGMIRAHRNSQAAEVEKKSPDTLVRADGQVQGNDGEEESEASTTRFLVDPESEQNFALDTFLASVFFPEMHRSSTVLFFFSILHVCLQRNL